MNDSNQGPLIIYHGNCADGFGAACAAKKFFDNEVGTGCDLYSATYSDQPPTEMIKDRRVVIVDFSYKRDAMIELAKHARSVLVLDHHKSAMEDLREDGDKIIGLGDWVKRHRTWEKHVYSSDLDRMDNVGYARVYTIFDMHRSGAGLTWDFFHGAETRPELINVIEHRDLWKFKEPPTEYDLFVRQVQAALFSLPYDYDIWHHYLQFDRKEDLYVLRVEGEAIERKHHKDVVELVAKFCRRLYIGGHYVPAANLPYTMTSDAGALMCKLNPEVPFAACYWDTPEGRVFSLRTVDGRCDVSKIAAEYGGGGHAAAAGFRVPIHSAAQFEAT